MGVSDVERFWLKNQPTTVISHFMRELGVTSQDLLLYAAEFLRVACYGSSDEPPRHELVQKTCSFIRQLNAHKHKLEEIGVSDVERFWLKNQPTTVISHLMRELGVTSQDLLLYVTEFLRVACYGSSEPPRHELVQKTCSFIRQLNAQNWNLTFTDSGHPVLVDIPPNSAQ